MVNQGQTFRNVGELKQGLQALPDDAKLSFGQISQGQSAGGAVGDDLGIKMIHDGDRVSFTPLGGDTTAGARSQV